MANSSDENGKGFFKKMRIRRNNKNYENKVSTPTRGKRSPLSFSPKNRNNQHNITDGVPSLQSRRVLKATRPPSPTTDVSSIMSSSDPDMTVHTSSVVARTNNNKTPTIQNENLKEKTEQWRQERMTKSAAIQKSNKEKEIMQHRLKSVKSADEVERKEEKVTDQPKVNMEVSDIFKTRTFHPEHKRKVTSDDHVEKKSKLDKIEQDMKENEETVVEESKEFIQSSKRSLMPFWIKFVAPAAVVAVCAVVMMKTILRKKR